MQEKLENNKRYGVMELLELGVIRCRWWMGNRNIIWSGLNAS